MLVKKCECGGEVHYLNFENLAECVKCFKSFKKLSVSKETSNGS